MFRISVWALAAGLASAGVACAADQPLYAPPAAWVKPVPIPADMKASGAAADLLLATTQDRLAPGDDETFVERAVRINAPEGLQQAGSLVQVWNPLTDTLTIHSARILRGGKVIDLLAGGHRFTVLRRETNLEAAMIDGTLTATLQPEGLQVGDVLDFAFTLARNEPALAGHSEGSAVAAHAGTIGRLVVKASWPAGKPFHTWKSDDLPKLTPVTDGAWTEVGFDQTDAVSPEAPKGAPVYDRLFGLMQVDDFKDWNAVSATFFPLFDKAATLAPNSLLKAEIARIRALSPDPKVRALAALKLVESQTRYLLVSLDAGGYTPAPADLTWTRRFGDCKGKTALLLALLRGLDVPAEPTLVHTTAGDALDRVLPAMGSFDHVMIRAEIGGRTYWLDGTRMGDENLDVIPVPNDVWTLPVRREGATLEPLGPKPPVLPYFDTVLKVDARAGIDKPARVHEELVMRGDLALYFNLAMKSASRIDADRGLRQAFTSQRSWLRPDKVTFTYDPQTMEGRAVLDGTGAPPFTSSAGDASGVRDWQIEGASIGYDPDFTRTSEYHRDAPFAVAYPLYIRTLVQLKLPGGGKDFETFNGETVDRTVAGMAYSRSAAISGDTFDMVSSSRAVAPSFPAAQAVAAADGLRGINGYDVSIRYTPPVAKSAASASPKSAVQAEVSGDPAAQAAKAFLAGDDAAAEAGFTAALASHKTAKLYYDRAAARAGLGKLELARADLDAALAIDPKDSLASYALGRIALRQGDLGEAGRRFAAAEANSTDAGKMAPMIALAYEAQEHYAEAYLYWDRAADAISEPMRKSQALNSGCWLRAEAGVDLKRALEECDAALSLSPGAAAVMDSRGLVELRLGALDKAVADYSAALAKRPSLPTSLFGRSLAERRLGQKAQADADATAARAKDPTIDKTFAGWGLPAPERFR